MMEQDPKDFASLGLALSKARDEGILAVGEYEPLAGALAVGVFTGTMDIDDYSAVHFALASVLEAVFEDPDLFASVPDSDSKGAILDSHLEVIGDMWGSVGDLTGADDPDDPTDNLLGFMEKCFDLKRASFGEECWFAAPLLVDLSTLRKQLKHAGISLISIEGQLNEGGSWVIAGDESCCINEGRFLLGWGDRRLGMALRDEMPTS